MANQYHNRQREIPYHDRGAKRGPYAGYGPRGYARTDDRIQDDINDRLTWDDRIDASDIQVTVSAGTVVLDGSVDSRRDKRIAEDIADSVSGVWDVHNHLRIRNRGYYRSGQGRVNRDDLQEGMQVVDVQGAPVGTIKEVHANDFLLNRSNARDIYVPFSACQVSGDQVRLNVSADQVNTQNWEEG